MLQVMQPGVEMNDVPFGCPKPAAEIFEDHQRASAIFQRAHHIGDAFQPKFDGQRIRYGYTITNNKNERQLWVNGAGANGEFDIVNLLLLACFMQIRRKVAIRGNEASDTSQRNNNRDNILIHYLTSGFLLADRRYRDRKIKAKRHRDGYLMWEINCQTGRFFRKACSPSALRVKIRSVASGAPELLHRGFSFFRCVQDAGRASTGCFAP